MKYKIKTLGIKRARLEKTMKLYYFGYYLPLEEGLIQEKPQY